MGVNQFFTDLAGHARTHPPTALARWRSEQQCARPGALAPVGARTVRPDGHGILTDGRHSVGFFLEHDNGGEHLAVLADKITRYETFTDSGGPRWPVLFWLPSTARERNVEALLDRVRPRIPVATAAGTASTTA